MAMADGNIHSFRGPWDPNGGPHFSKRDLLEVAIRYGAIYTAKLDGEELPYEGARFHADELEAEGKFKRVPGVVITTSLEGVLDFAIWAPTSIAESS
jgi:hypothetical protein